MTAPTEPRLPGGGTPHPNPPRLCTGCEYHDDVRPTALDAFSGAGGAGMGYFQAGFCVTGVDHAPQPQYPFRFVQADALDFLDDHARDFALRHASPPCQWATAYRRRGAGVGDGYPNLIAPVRDRLRTAGPYVIENVTGARGHLVAPVTLCGSSFGLDVRRHRLFETNVPLMVPPCDHSWQTPRFPAATNRSNLRRTVEVGVWRIPLEVQQRAMGIDWMRLRELTLAIPPAYTRHIGAALLAHLSDAAAA